MNKKQSKFEKAAARALRKAFHRDATPGHSVDPKNCWMCDIARKSVLDAVTKQLCAKAWAEGYWQGIHRKPPGEENLGFRGNPYLNNKKEKSNGSN